MKGETNFKEEKKVQEKTIRLASWGTRFLAWIIDVILVNIFWGG